MQRSENVSELRNRLRMRVRLINFFQMTLKPHGSPRPGLRDSGWLIIPPHVIQEVILGPTTFSDIVSSETQNPTSK